MGCSISAFCGLAIISSFGEFVINVTPLIVMREAIHPITPRYIIRMHVAIKGASASPNVCTRSCVAIMLKLSVKKPYALMKVKIRRAIPRDNTATPLRAILSLNFFSISFHEGCVFGKSLY